MNVENSKVLIASSVIYEVPSCECCGNSLLSECKVEDGRYQKYHSCINLEGACELVGKRIICKE